MYRKINKFFLFPLLSTPTLLHDARVASAMSRDVVHGSFVRSDIPAIQRSGLLKCLVTTKKHKKLKTGMLH